MGMRVGATLVASAVLLFGCTSEPAVSWIEGNYKHSKKARAVLKQGLDDYIVLLGKVDDRSESIAAYREIIKTRYCAEYILRTR